MPRRIDTQAEIDAIRLKEATAPGTPASGYGKLYAKTDGKLYWKDDGGTETDITGAGSSNGFWHVDKPPASPSAYDDEFNDSSFDTGLWTVVNSVTETLTESTNGLHITTTTNGGTQITIYKQTAPSTPYNIYAGIELLWPFGNYGGVGLCVRDSSDGETVTWGFVDGTTAVYRWNSAVSYGSTPFVQGPNVPTYYFRIENDGTNLNFYRSSTGRAWRQYYTETLAAFIDTADEIGFYIYYSGSPEGIIKWFRVNDQGGGTI